MNHCSIKPIVLGTFLLFQTMPACAEPGVIHLHVSDMNNHPQKGLVFCLTGKSKDSKETDGAGKTIIRVPVDTPKGAFIEITFKGQMIYRGTKKHDWMIVRPPNGRTAAPPFDDAPSSVVDILVNEIGSSEFLTKPAGIMATGPKIIQQLHSGLDGKLNEQQRRKVLEEKAKEYGITVDQMDQAIRAWLNQANNPECKAIACMYNQDYAQAEKLLNAAGTQQLEQTGQINLLLGHSQYEQGKYNLAIQNCTRAIEIDPNDVDAMNILSMSHAQLGELSVAEQLGRKALSIAERIMVPEDPALSVIRNDLGVILIHQGKNKEAQALLQDALASHKSKVDPHAAIILGNKACARFHSDPAGAENDLKTALEMLGDSKDIHVREAKSAFMNNLAEHYVSQGLHDMAESLFKQSIQLDHGLSKLDEARDLNNLGKLYLQSGKSSQAVDSLKQAFDLKMQVSTPNKNSLIKTLLNLSTAYRNLGQEAEATSAVTQANKLLEACKDPEPGVVFAVKQALGSSSESEDVPGANVRIPE